MLTAAAIWVPTALCTAVAMEFWAALVHRYVWHRVLWRVHRSHHVPQRGRWEANDVLSVLHAPGAITLILYGCRAEAGWAREIAFGVGLGMSLFGVAYGIVHDGLVHGRLPVSALASIPYLARVREAHREHHQPASRGGPYGLFFGPWEKPVQKVRRSELTQRTDYAQSKRTPLSERVR